MTKYQALIQEFSEALQRFEEVLRKEKDKFIRDSAIKRFELVYDISWKTIKALLEEKGVDCASPLLCFKEAYRQDLVGYEEIWVALIKLRNKTVHTYHLKLAEEVYQALPKALEAFQKLKAALSKDVG